MHLSWRRRLRTLAHHRAVQPLQMLRLQPVQPMLGPASDVLHHRSAGRRIARLMQVGSGYVLQPMLQPSAQGPSRSRPTDPPLVPLTLQLANLDNYDTLRLPTHVTPVKRAVLAITGVNPAVPAPIRAQIDRLAH